jgi:hypothetical protein
MPQAEEAERVATKLREVFRSIDERIKSGMGDAVTEGALSSRASIIMRGSGL